MQTKLVLITVNSGHDTIVRLAHGRIEPNGKVVVSEEAVRKLVINIPRGSCCRINFSRWPS